MEMKNICDISYTTFGNENIFWHHLNIVYVKYISNICQIYFGKYI